LRLIVERGPLNAAALTQDHQLAGVLVETIMQRLPNFAFLF
jgi:hypothetical protein